MKYFVRSFYSHPKNKKGVEISKELRKYENALISIDLKKFMAKVEEIVEMNNMLDRRSAHITAAMSMVSTDMALVTVKPDGAAESVITMTLAAVKSEIKHADDL